MIGRPLIYLAGPGVFRHDAEMYGANLKRMARVFGLEGLWPLDSVIEAETPIAVAHAIRRENLALIERCSGVIADISPFRGVNMDPGTAYELGFADAICKPIFAWSNDLRPILNRVVANGEPVQSRNGQNYDGANKLIENFMLPENLMIACALKGIYRAPEEAMLAAATILAPTARKAAEA